MPASKPLITGTKHILPFSSLSPLDFERLCLWLVQREGFERAEHLGAAGSEQGRDIVAWREGEQWAFQCKRVQSFTAATARKEIQKLFDELPVRRIPIPRHYVFAASCLISSEIREQIGKEYGDRLELDFWAVTELDEKVKKHSDILEEFFQLDTAIEQPHRFLTTLPQRAEHFTGRERELAHLLDMLHPGRAATLVAVGGMGKTALAVEALYDLPQTRFPDGIFFHTFYHQPQAAVCLERICRAFEREPLPDPAQAAGMALADRKALLVLDGAEQADDLRPILNVAGECGVLITTRRRSDAPNYQYFLELTPLAEDKSLSLLQQWGQECAADEAAGKAVIQITGGLPLAIRLVGRYLRGQNQTAGAYLAWLQTTPLEALEQGQRQLESVPLLLARSLEALPEAAAQVLALMGVLAYAPLPLDLLEPALGLGQAEERRLLAGLLDYGLLLRRQPGDPLLELAHPLVHTYASRRLSIPLEAPARLAEHLYCVFKEQTPQGARAFPRLEQYRPHLLALQGWMLAREQWRVVMDITWAVDGYLDLSGHWTERISSLQAGYQAAVRAENRYNQGAFLTKLGNAYQALGQVQQAIQHYQQALEIAREIGDRRAEEAALGNLGNASWNLGQVEQAITYYQRALEIALETGDRRGEGNALGNLGLAYADLGQVEQAIKYHQQALEIAREIGDRNGEGADLGNLGNAYYSLGQVEQAIEYHRQALEIAWEIGDRRNEGIMLGNLGYAYFKQGKLEQAQAYSRRALIIAREIGNRANEGVWLNNLAEVFESQGHLIQAVRFASSALNIFSEIKSPEKEDVQKLLTRLREKMGEDAFQAALSTPGGAKPG